MEGLENKQSDLEFNSFSHREPVQFFQNRCDMIEFSSSGDKTGGRDLHSL